MAERRHIVLFRPLTGLLDTLYRTVPVSLLAICRRLDLDRYRVTVIDQVMPGWKEQLRRALAGEVLLFGITSLTGHQQYYGAAVARHVRRLRPDVTLVWGGVHPTSTPEQTLAEPFVDVVVIGEGEHTFPALVHALARDGDLATIDGLGWTGRDGEVRINPRKAMIDVTDLEPLPYDLVDMATYLDQIEEIGFLVEGARGCVLNCSFCYNPSYNQRRWRPRSAERIVDDIEHLQREHGIHNFFIADDSFFISARRAREFVELLLQRGLRITWGSEANCQHLGALDDATLARLADSGLNWVAIGVESGSARVRRYYDKDIDEGELLELNRRAARHGIHTRYNFITGAPVEQKQDLRATIDLIERLLAENDAAMVQAAYITVPFPGTRYLEQCREYGLEPPTDFAGWMDYDPFTVARHMPWMRGRMGRMHTFLMVSSFFVDRKLEYHAIDSAFSRAVNLLGRGYRPLARFRLDHMLYRPFPEGAFVKLLNRAQQSLADRQMRL
jgi:anaerobic magnesium-protoporphyrin IX monomethyl ester cyclase